jgi:hypothetical protein
MYFDNLPIITDFNRFGDYIRTKGTLDLTKSTANLRAVDLLALNEKMRHPVQITKNKPTHKDFILLTAFYYIGLSAELWVIKRDAKGLFHLEAQCSRLAIYDQMTDDERYGFLLQAYWCYFDMEAAYDDRSTRMSDLLFKMLPTFPVGKTTAIRSNPMVAAHRVTMLSALGMFDYSNDNNQKESTNWAKMNTVTLTEIGRKMLPILGSIRLQVNWVDLDPKMTQKRAKKLFDHEEALKSRPALLDFFSEFKSVYPDWKVETRLFPIEKPVVTGFFSFKISLSPHCYRIIDMHSGATLEELHRAIQEIFDFDNDHLYAFYLNGRISNRAGNIYSDPRGDIDYDEYPADILTLGELGLYIGQSILYLFDFGDNWEFTVQFTAFSASDNKPTAQYELKESVGEAPEQY